MASSEGGCELLDEFVTVVVTDEIGSVDVVVTVDSLALPLPFATGRDCCFVGGERTCFDVVELLVVVVVDVEGTAFCETIAAYCKTGTVEVLPVLTG